MKRMFYITLMIFVLVGFFAWARTVTPVSTCSELASSTSAYAIVGHRVTNFGGTNPGTIENVVVDTKDGHPVYALISFDDPAFSGKAAMIPRKTKMVLIPWEKLTFGPTQRAILLNTDETMLANAPQLDDVSQGINGKVDAEIQRYWSKGKGDKPSCLCQWCHDWD
jgi:sporulation protein YlmC with PRC-barrel domain